MFYKDDDDLHYYKVLNKTTVLHVLNPKREKTVTATQQIADDVFFEEVYDVQPGECLINTIGGLPNKKLHDIDEEEFAQNLREAIFHMGIWEYVKSEPPKKKYYYVHPESDSVWWSYKSPEESAQFDDGCTVEVDEERAKAEAEALGLPEIPYSEN